MRVSGVIIGLHLTLAMRSQCSRAWIWPEIPGNFLRDDRRFTTTTCYWRSRTPYFLKTRGRPASETLPGAWISSKTSAAATCPRGPQGAVARYAHVDSETRENLLCCPHPSPLPLTSVTRPVYTAAGILLQGARHVAQACYTDRFPLLSFAEKIKIQWEIELGIFFESQR